MKNTKSWHGPVLHHATEKCAATKISCVGCLCNERWPGRRTRELAHAGCGAPQDSPKRRAPRRPAPRRNGREPARRTSRTHQETALKRQTTDRVIVSLLRFCQRPTT